MFMRTSLVGWALALAGVAAQANTSHTLHTPTDLPYTRIEGHAAPGSFTDTVSFSLNGPHEGYVWLFARQDWLLSGLDNIQNASLTLRNDSTGDTWAGLNFAQAQGGISYLDAEALNLTLAGLDPNKSLWIAGNFAAGQYSALISGVASGLNGGTYVAKFSMTPAIPEPSSLWMMGLGVLALTAIRARSARA